MERLAGEGGYIYYWSSQSEGEGWVDWPSLPYLSLAGVGLACEDGGGGAV